MTSRERVHAAMRYQAVDKIPVQHYYCPVGYYEHGDKLNKLYERLPGDFGPHINCSIPVLPPEDFDTEGKYHVLRRDFWGTVWEYRIFGVAGIPKEFPLADMDNLKNFKMPPLPHGHKWGTDEYYHQFGVGSLFERMIELRPEEDVLCDIATDDPQINKLADILTDYSAELTKIAVQSGSDGICMGDDFGTERALIMNPELFRSFFKPRYQKIFQSAVDAGLDIHFHSCGYIWDILEDLHDVGVTSIWPQLPRYDMKALADRCKALGLAVAIHTDRANVMTFGTPRQVRELVLREYDTFKMHSGGSWFYIEADNGFPYENIVALVETVGEIR